ncbi:MAG: hypothetical protein [Wendovervirus sonii]|uniref:Uncharacterized protein n=1 Tax=phage Lak_Megaphage_Sonny TaxID=3109229 RepID=A0ABZ0Z5X2_9CAUD|nr:MAG: hypothetical protein [phage Lak_Megaphage_Sonny]
MGKAKEHPYTVVYVYAPAKYKDAYMKGIAIPEIKLGETTSDYDDCKSCMIEAMKRINQQSTSFKEYMYLLQWFVFPYKKGTDDAIRDILTNDIYRRQSSKKIDKTNQSEDERMTKIGQEFAYNINLMQVNTAVSVYKLKTKIEDLMNDKCIDPAFKKRLNILLKDLMYNLDDVITESGKGMKALPIDEQKKIIYLDILEQLKK